MYDVSKFDSDAAASDLRAEMARHMIPIYHLSAKIGLHPSYLGQLLRGRRPLTPDVAERIMQGIQELAKSHDASDRSGTGT